MITKINYPETTSISNKILILEISEKFLQEKIILFDNFILLQNEIPEDNFSG